jgi:hypothetical protein
MDRRNLLKYSGYLIGGSLLYRPSLRLAQKIFENKVNLSKDKKSNQIRNYVQFNIYGAPSRWGLDSLLKPYSDSSFIQNKFLGNEIQVNQNTDHGWKIIYSTETNKGLNLPPIWSDQLNLQTNQAPLSDLLDNALFIRGCRLKFQGHPLNGAQQVAPVPGDFSIHGSIGDMSTAFFSSISTGNNPVSRAYKSKKSQLLEIPIQEENYAEYLFRPYFIEDGKRIFNTNDLNEDFDMIADHYKDLDIDLQKIKKDSIKDIKNNIDQYVEEFGVLSIKYANIIRKALDGAKVHNDCGTPTFPYSMKGKKTIPDMIGPYSIDENFFETNSISEFIKTGEIKYWAQEFALAEFLIKNNLCQSILLSTPNEIGNLFDDCTSSKAYNFKDFTTTYNSTTNQTTIYCKPGHASKSSFKQRVPMDSHGSGAIIEVLSTKLFFTAFSRCLQQFIQELKSIKVSSSENLFDNTVIHLASEFDRIPNENGFGSGHLPLSNPTTIFSGVIKGPILIGNIYSGTLDKNKWELYGTLGVGAPSEELDGHIDISNVSSTISKLINLNPIVKRAPSLIDYKNGQVCSLLSKARNVDGVI